MDDESDGAANSSFVYREPPPSLGMVAHIWAGQLGPTADEPGGDTGEPPDGDTGDGPGGDVIDLTQPREGRITID